MPSRAARLTWPIAHACFAMSLGAACGDAHDPLDTAAPTSTAATSGASAGTGEPTGTDTTGGDTTGGDADDPAWMTPYCYMVADAKWQAVWLEREQKIVELVNQVRAEGRNCGSMGQLPPTGPLTLEPRMHCAARKHSQDMAERNFFDHDNPDGESPFDRITEAGYEWSAAGENIAAGSDDPATTMQGWLDSDGHCANLMDSKYKHIGVGFYEGPGDYTYYWTQTFAAPQP